MDIQLGTMLFQIIMFLILLALVSKFAMKPAMSILQKRQENIEGQIAAAEKANAEAQGLLQEQRAELKKFVKKHRLFWNVRRNKQMWRGRKSWLLPRLGRSV